MIFVEHQSKSNEQNIVSIQTDEIFDISKGLLQKMQQEITGLIVDAKKNISNLKLDLEG